MNFDEIETKAEELLQDAEMQTYEYNVYDYSTGDTIGTLFTTVDYGKELNGVLIRSDDDGKA